MKAIGKYTSILVLDDEVFLRREITSYLTEQGAEVMEAASVAEARNLLAQQSFDFALLDIHLPDGLGLDLLRHGEITPTTGVVIMTGEGALQTAVEALRLGAGDYLSKPFEVEELNLVLSRLRKNRQRARADEYKRRAPSDQTLELFFGDRLHQLRQALERILEADARLGQALPPILIEGETGTGKSSLARWIHAHGPRADQPLVEVNCAALPDSLAESELFGHEKGAFTDARQARLGLFEAADGGTLFLDEVSSLSLSTQAKLLTAIENRQIRRVGSHRTQPVDVRLIVASLHDLETLVAEGRFREDLFHRLNLLRLRVPSLREHPRDIPLVAEHLLQDLRRRYRRPQVEISERGLERLQAYPWPGNLRELKHELERALIFAPQEELDFPHLAPDITPGSSPPAQPPATPEDSTALRNPAWTLPAQGFDLEKEIDILIGGIIEQALREADHNVSAAARRLGVPRDYLRYRMRSQG